MVRRALVFTLIAGLAAACGGSPDLPDPDSEAYEAFVADFYSGLAALQVGDNDRALTGLESAAEIAPGEPAVWANLAVTHLRRTETDMAAEDLATAQELLADDPRLALLEGEIAARSGQVEQAIASYQRAIEIDPAAMRARYALVQELERTGAADVSDRAREQIEAILERDPDNLVARLDLLRLAVRAEDRETVLGTLRDLQTVSEEWPEEAADQLDEAIQAADADISGAVPAIAVLTNLLRPTPGYQAGLTRLTSVEAEVGRPFEQLVALPSPSPKPAPIDADVTFAVESLGAGRWAKAIAVDAEGNVAVAVGDGEVVRLADGTTLDAPGAIEPAGLVSADWSGDGQPDLVMAGPEGLVLAERTPDGWDAGPADGLDPEPSDLTGVWSVDFELDGDLDLLVSGSEGVSVLRNNGDGTWDGPEPFDPVDEIAALVWTDIDADGDPDMVVLDESGTPVLLDNRRNGRYEAIALGSAGAVGLTLADVDTDSLLDVLIVADDGSLAVLNETHDGWEFEASPIGADAGLFSLGDGMAGNLVAADLDNNGAVDLAAGGQVLLRGPDGAAQTVAVGGADAGLSAVLSAHDVNGDGLVDLVGVAGDGSPAEAINQGGSQAYHWQALRPRAAQVADGRINSFGLGGEVEARAGLLVTRRPIDGPAVHIGLGTHETADVVRIYWPNGTNQAEFDLAADQSVAAEQRLKGSCPWLFAHNGTSVEFVTDILWRSPLGLRINAQDTAGVMTTRDWVRVSGDQLAPVDGVYDLRITAELWETHYFDHVGLMVVDHPVGTEAFVDERFAFPPPDTSVTLTSELRPLVAAQDHAGDDVAATLAELDGDYVQVPLGRYQGLAAEHTLTLEVEAEADWLVAQGWTYPTDSSLNVAIGQSSLAPPHGVVIEVPGADGEWQVARENLGFPAGKTKTMLIDLEGLWPADVESRRMRFRTTSEIYWDRLATAQRVDAVPRLMPLAPETTELRYRGYSATTHDSPDTPRWEPEIPVYGQVRGTSPRWFDLAGFYTRFGPVDPLLESVDDRYVILNAGDELRLTFSAQLPPDSGWTRDFIFVSDGWNKDGDFNTAYSDTVGPMPSHDRPDYAADLGPGGPDLLADPIYRQNGHDWIDYHTRYVTGRTTKSLLQPQVLEDPTP